MFSRDAHLAALALAERRQLSMYAREPLHEIERAFPEKEEVDVQVLLRRLARVRDDRRVRSTSGHLRHSIVEDVEIAHGALHFEPSARVSIARAAFHRKGLS